MILNVGYCDTKRKVKMCLSMVQHSRKEAEGMGGWALKRVTSQPCKSEQEANCEVSGAAHAPSVLTSFCALAKIH